MISVVVPVMNEADNVGPLIKEIAAAAQKAPITEILFVDDGSTDATLATLKGLKTEFPALRVLRHSIRAGQSAALRTGIRATKNQIVATLDGDGQNDPADIALLYTAGIAKDPRMEGFMVAGERTRRNDSYIRRMTSRIANNIRSLLLKDNTRDTGCSLKMFRRDDYLALPYFNHMHRFLPALMMRDGVQIVHVGVSHRPRTMGVSKYGTLDRLLVGVTDLLGMLWLQSRASARITVHEE